MLSKLNQWLLSRYPLIWNTRVWVMLPLSLLLHLAFFAAGLLQPASFARLHEHDMGLETGFYLFGILTGLVMLIAWLVFYLRQNAFKLYYPLGRGRLIAEYGIISLILLSIICLNLSYQQGFYQKVRQLTRHTNPEEEARIVNLAYHFLPFDLTDFSVENSCDSIRYREAQNRIAMLQSGAEPEQDVIQTVAAGKENTTDTLTVEHSYLHNCQAPELLIGRQPDRYELSKTARSWLLNQERDSVIRLLDAYLALCRKYRSDYRFNSSAHVDDIFASSRFLVRRELMQGDERDGRKPFIRTWNTEAAIRNIQEARSGFWNDRLVMALLYGALLPGLLLMSFRLSSTRTFFIALTGLVVWGIIFALAGTLMRSETGLAAFFITIWVLLTAYAMLGIYQRGRKLWTGMAMLWSAWAMPAIIPVLMGLVEKMLERPYLSGSGTEIRLAQHPVYNWIQENEQLILALNLLLIVAFTALALIPLARRWQANPEE